MEIVIKLTGVQVASSSYKKALTAEELRPLLMEKIAEALGGCPIDQNAFLRNYTLEVDVREPEAGPRLDMELTAMVHISEAMKPLSLARSARRRIASWFMDRYGYGAEG